MKIITIHQSETESIVLKDDNNEPLEQYCLELSTVMKMNNIAIIQTTSDTAIIRPSKVTGIKVVEENVVVDEKPQDNIEEVSEQIEEKINDKTEVEDIITDVDN